MTEPLTRADGAVASGSLESRTMQASTKSLHYWTRYRTSSGMRDARLYEAFHFGDNEALADELAALVLAGVKCASAGLLWSFEAACKPAPEVGDLSIVESWSGEPLCIIETTSTAVTAFCDVGAAFAAAEGEGDGSLDHWRAEHWSAFGRECLRLGKRPSARMPVVCEHFVVVHRSAAR